MRAIVTIIVATLILIAAATHHSAPQRPVYPTLDQQSMAACVASAAICAN